MSPAPLALPAAAVEVVASVAEHRVLTTAQVREIHFPANRVRWAQKVLARLEAAGLVAKARPQHAPRRLWFVTEDGAQLAQDAGALIDAPKVFDARAAVNQLQHHTLAVNDTGACFLAAARQRGDEFGPLSWRHEIAHPLGTGRGRRLLIADAVLTYLVVGEGKVTMELRFLELDRATLAVDRLAAKLGRYAELHGAQDKNRRPLWRGRYPYFPPVLCVLAGAPRALLERRRETVTALLAASPDLREASQVEVFTCLLEDLQDRGPFAPIFASPRDPSRRVHWRERAAKGGRG